MQKLKVYVSLYLGWMILFFIIPTTLIFLVSFMENQSWNAITAVIRDFHPNVKNLGWQGAIRDLFSSQVWSEIHFNFNAYKELIEPRVVITVARTFFISIIAACVCVILSLPSAYFIAQSPLKSFWLMLIAVPFWTNFLLRIYAWITVLGNNGIINSLLIRAGIIPTPVQLLYNNFSVIIISIYVALPFAIIPIFSAIEKFDFSLLEAAEDLGATPWQSFWNVFLPNIRNGIFSAFVFVFINTFGNYAVAKLVGGQSSYVLGTLVAHNATVGRNMPLAAAISSVISILALCLMFVNSAQKGAKYEI